MSESSASPPPAQVHHLVAADLVVGSRRTRRKRNPTAKTIIKAAIASGASVAFPNGAIVTASESSPAGSWDDAVAALEAKQRSR